MNKKILCIGLMIIFLFSSINAVGISINGFDNEEKNNDFYHLQTSDEITIELFDMTISGEGWASTNDCHTKKLTNDAVITIPRDIDLTINLKSNWKIKRDQAEYRDEWQFKMYCSLKNGNEIGDKLIKEDTWIVDIVDDSGNGELKTSFTVDSSYHGYGCDVHGWVWHYRSHRLQPSDYGWVNSNSKIKINFEIENSPPNIPDVANGPTNVKKDQEYSYTINPSDPNGDTITNYEWKFERLEEGFQPIHTKKTDVPEVKFNFPLAFPLSKENWELTVKVKDEYGAWSDWSEPLTITSSRVKNKVFNEMSLGKFLEIFPILQYLLNL